MPPDWMWPFEDELELWFDNVEAARKEKYGGGAAAEADDVPMMENQLSPNRR